MLVFLMHRGSPLDIESALAGSLAGDKASWVRLLGQLWDLVDAIVRGSRRMGQLRGSIDDRREVISRVFARLRRNEFRALHTFAVWHQRNPGKTFHDWLTILVTNVIRDYVSERLGDVDQDGRGLKRLVNTLADSLDARDDERSGLRPAITRSIAAMQLIATARAILPDDQHAALRSWLTGSDFGEIAAELDWPNAIAARNKVRAALARLRREVKDREE